MEIPLSEGFNYKTLRLTDIIELLTTSSNEDQIRSLWSEVYNRLGQKFFDRCHKITQKRYGTAPDWEATRDDLIQETFLTAFEAIKNFTPQNHWDDNECEKVVLSWLAGIANNKILRLIKTEVKEKENLEKYKYHLITDARAGGVGKTKYEPTYDKVKFDKIWSKLNPMTKEILEACWDFETLSEENLKHLPDPVIANLVEKYDVKKAAIRKAKSRAIELIKSCKIVK